MSPALQKGADVLPSALYGAMRKGATGGWILELDGSEYDALWELARELEKMRHSPAVPTHEPTPQS